MASSSIVRLYPAGPPRRQPKQSDSETTQRKQKIHAAQPLASVAESKSETPNPQLDSTKSIMSVPPDSAGAGHPPQHESETPNPQLNSNAPGPLEYFDKVAGYFVEAARRLPMAQIPYLAHCIRMKSLAFGLADPVTNILITTIDTFAHTEPYMVHRVDRAEIEQTKNKATFTNNARCSWVAMNRFMVCYFRYLTGPQADVLLHMADYDLRVAIEAVQIHIGGPNYRELLVLDSARTKTAFDYAAYPLVNLSRLMTSRYRRCLVEPVVEDLRRGRELTADCVYKVCNFLRHPWSPPLPRPPPPTPGTFWDSGGGFTIVTCVGGDSFTTTRVSKDGVATATFTSFRPTHADFSKDATDMLRMFPIHHGRLISHRDFCSVTLERPDFLPFLKFQLLDMIHGVYLKAIAMLPVRALREGHLLHSLVTAGHCYGPLDIVSNIVINTIWYDVVFPLSKDVACKVGAADILDVRSMHRVESRSIDGLVAYLCRSPSINEHDAVTLLCKNRLDTPILDLSNMCDVALAAKHPQPAAFGAFLERASIRHLYNMYRLSRVHGNPDSAFEGLKMALLQETARVAAPVQRCAHDMDKLAALQRLNSTPSQKTILETLSAERSSFMFQQANFRRVLEHLLVGYGYSDPLAPLYKLGVICGVTRQINYSHTDVYHANFLASSDGGASWKLFFAEFWNQLDKRIEESKNPFCCPVLNYPEYPGRCEVCENDSSIIMHPPSHKYYMGNSALPFMAPSVFEPDTSGELEFDLIYLNL